jgi:predicted  nucleic acid-binding Zn-ribbon protein
MAIRMQQRRGTAAQWTAANPTLAAGEIGFETDTNQFKIGNGSSTWSALSYFKNLDGLDGVGGIVTLDSAGLIPSDKLPDQYLTDKINTRIGEVVGAAPTTLDTLNEIAAAFNNNPNYADSVTAALADKASLTQLASKAPLESPTFTGTAVFDAATFAGEVNVPTPQSSDDSTKPATTAFVQDKVEMLTAEILALETSTDGNLDTITTNVQGIAEDVVDLQTSVTSINTSITNINGDIATLQANDISQTNSLTGLDTRLDAAESTITGNSASISTINTTLSNIATDISSLDGRVDSTESDISSIDTTILGVQGDISSINTTISGIQSDVSDLDSSLTSAQSNISTLQSDLSDAKSDITTLQTNLSTLDTNVDAIDTRVTAAESDITSLQTSATSASGHANATTNVHGIANTADLATKSYADNAKTDAITTSATAIALKADIASPALTGTPTAPTATAGTNTTQIATTEFVGTAVANLVASAPAALNTLDELAAALGDDANFASTVTTSLAAKAPTASPTFTGTVALPAASSVTLGGTALSTTLATKSDNAATINTMSGSHTIVSADVSNIREMSNGGTITIPADNSFWPVGASMDVIQTGSSQVTVAGGSGVTVNATPGLKLRAQWSSATILKRAANTFVVMGDLSA